MNEVNTTALLERVKRLERQNKQIKLTGIVAVLGMALVLCCGAKDKVPKEIVTESFHVVDTEGRARAGLYVDQDDNIALGLFDKNGKPRAVLGVTQKGPQLALHDKNGKLCASLYVDQEAGLGLFDKNGKPRAILAVDQIGSALYLLDENGETEFSAP